MSEPLVALQQVHFAYEPRREVLDGLDLELHAGQRLAICGGIGSGKTTLLHLLVGLLRPDAGRVWAFGRLRRREADFREVRRRAGLVFQDADDQLFCPTVIEDVAFGPLNLGLSPAEARRRAVDTLRRIGLAGFEDRVTYRLSGGEKRLTALAAVLAMDPEVLLLDEPTAGLDAEAAGRVSELLSELPQAMLLVSHDAETVAGVAHERRELRDGRL